MRPNQIRAPFTALLALGLVLLFLTACHDDIPHERDAAESAGIVRTDPDSAQARSFDGSGQSEMLSYGVTEQRNLPPNIYVTYRVNRGGPAWEGVSLHMNCGHGRSIVISHLPWPGHVRAVLRIGLDDAPEEVEEVSLQRYEVYSPDGQEERASVQLDDAVWYERMRSAETLTVELVDSGLEPASFDLTRLFGTPFQDQIDNCAEWTVTRRVGTTRVSVGSSR